VTAWLVVAPHRGGDPSLEGSLWVAERTLALAPDPPPRALLRGDATRAGFDALVAESEPLAGVAFFGYGEGERLLDADLASLLDAKNVRSLFRCWVHAYACMAAWGLGALAERHGVLIFVGYEIEVAAPVPVGLDPEVTDALTGLVTAVTFALARGETQEQSLRQLAADASERLLHTMARRPRSEDPMVDVHLRLLARQLVDHLAVR